METHKAGDCALRLPGFVSGVLFDRLLDSPVHVVRRVVGKHVEDEALTDRLAHRVKVEWLEALLCLTPATKKLKGPLLGGGGEGEEGEASLLAPCEGTLGPRLFDRILTS